MDDEQLLEMFTADGVRLRASVFVPRTAPRAVMVINSAMGVPRRIYTPLARYLCAHGLAVLTYDYRGIAESAPATLRRFDGDLLDWARRDFPAAVATARAKWPNAPLVVLGHSVGGQLFGLDRAGEQADALIGVAAQSGYWRHWHGIGRIGLWLFWHVAIPVLTPLFGYFPSRMLGFGQNLPRNVATRWASWGRRPLYVRDPQAGPPQQCFDTIQAPLLSIGIEDDKFAPHDAVAAFRRWFIRARITTVDIPAAERLGHFGWFQATRGERYWAAAFEWLESHVVAAAPRANAQAV